MRSDARKRLAEQEAASACVGDAFPEDRDWAHWMFWCPVHDLPADERPPSPTSG